jgi:hypothetical protein
MHCCNLASCQRQQQQQGRLLRLLLLMWMLRALHRAAMLELLLPAWQLL